jgi:hypothetical protein
MLAGRPIVVFLTGLMLAGCQRHWGESPVTAAVGPVASRPAVENEAPSPPNQSGLLAIAWDELDVGIPAGSVFEPWMMKTSIKSLEGQSVRITGYMHGGLAISKGVREFVLLRNIDCPYGRQGEAHHAMIVDLQGGLRTDFTTQPVTVEGKFRVKPYQGPDGTTWALYLLEGTAIQIADGDDLSPPTTHSQPDEDAR